MDHKIHLQKCDLLQKGIDQGIFHQQGLFPSLGKENLILLLRSKKFLYRHFFLHSYIEGFFQKIFNFL